MRSPSPVRRYEYRRTASPGARMATASPSAGEAKPRNPLSLSEERVRERLTLEASWRSARSSCVVRCTSPGASLIGARRPLLGQGEVKGATPLPSGEVDTSPRVSGEGAGIELDACALTRRSAGLSRRERQDPAEFCLRLNNLTLCDR